MERLWKEIRHQLDSFAAQVRIGACGGSNLERFCNILRHHWEFSQSYRDLLLAHGLPKGCVPESLSDLSTFPTIDKDFLAKFPYEDAGPVGENIATVSTSGTTSLAARIVHNESSLRTGLGENFARAIVLGDLDNERWCLIGHWEDGSSDLSTALSGSFLSMDWLKRQLRAEVLLHNGSDGLENLVDEMIAFKPTAIASSPNLLAALARVFVARDITMPMTGLLYGGAAATTSHRKLWEKAFKPKKIVAFYPTTDAGALGMSSKDDGVYESFPETHFLEVLDPQGRHVEIGERGLVTVTSFESLVAPIIRYRVGDEATYHGVKGGRVNISAVERYQEIMIGDALLPIGALKEWTSALVAQGFDIEGIQLVMRLAPDGRDHPELKVYHERYVNAAALESALRSKYFSVGQLRYEADNETTIAPDISFADALDNYEFKISPYKELRNDSHG